MKKEKTKLLTVSCTLLSSLIMVMLPFMVDCAPVEAAPPAHEEVNLILHTSTFGSLTYNEGYAIEQIFKKHPWLKVVCLEGMGALDNYMTVSKLNPKRRQYRIFIMGNQAYYDAIRGSRPFKEKATDIRGVMFLKACEFCFVTLDPKIKTHNDFVGKKVASWPVGSGTTIWFHHVLDAFGIRDKVKPTYGSPKAMSDALKDGLIDVLFLVTFGGVPVGAYTELFSLKGEKLHFVGIPKEAYDKLVAGGWPVVPYTYPPGKLTAAQTEGIPAFGSPVACWWCWKDAPEDVIYEFVKTVGENIQVIKDYVKPGQESYKKEMGMLVVDSEADLHPGALKYFKEEGLKLAVRGK